MRVLILTDRYPPHYAGGYEIACHSVAERLRRRGIDLRVLTSTYGVRTETVEGHVYRQLHRPQDSASLVELARWENHDNRTLARLIDSWRPDLVYAWSMFQLFASLHATLREKGVPVVFNIQDIWLPTQLALCEELRLNWLAPGTDTLRRIAKPVVRTAIKLQYPSWLRPISIEDVDLGHVIFCSRFRQRQHVEQGLPLGDSTVVYNGIDVDRFDDCRRAAGDRLRVMFCGRLVPEKGAHTAIEAMKEVAMRSCRSISLTVVGGPSHPWEYAEQLREIVAANRLEEYVEFAGAVPNDRIMEIYRRHDVLVFPSICDEGLPVTMLEAMACGLPVVGTTTGGSAEILRDGVTGLTFSPGRSVELAERLIEIAAEPDQRRTLGIAGQQLVRANFGIEKVCDQTEEYLRAVALN